MANSSGGSSYVSLCLNAECGRVEGVDAGRRARVGGMPPRAFGQPFSQRSLRKLTDCLVGREILQVDVFVFERTPQTLDEDVVHAAPAAITTASRISDARTQNL